MMLVTALQRLACWAALVPAPSSNIAMGVQVAGGAAEVLLGQLGSIRLLKPQGVQQLAADLEYFCNVLSALGVAPPSTLATWQAKPTLLCTFLGESEA